MSIEVISFYVLGLIIVGVVSYFAGRHKDADRVAMLQASLQGERLSREKWQNNYNQIYDAFLRVNQYNTELHKKLLEKSRDYEDVIGEMYAMLLKGSSRKEIASHFKIPYSTTCQWLRKYQKEQLGNTQPSPVDPSGVTQMPVL